MKRTFGPILSVFLAAGSIASQETRPTSRPGGSDLELIRTFEQWSASHPDGAARLKARMDQNDDGHIDASEKELALQILRERREEFQKWTRDQAEAERKLREKREQELKSPPPEEPVKAVRPKADANKDGRVDAKERERQIQRAKERMERNQREKGKAPGTPPAGK